MNEGRKAIEAAEFVTVGEVAVAQWENLETQVDTLRDPLTDAPDDQAVHAILNEAKPQAPTVQASVATLISRPAQSEAQRRRAGPEQSLAARPSAMTLPTTTVVAVGSLVFVPVCWYSSSGRRRSSPRPMPGVVVRIDEGGLALKSRSVESWSVTGPVASPGRDRLRTGLRPWPVGTRRR